MDARKISALRNDERRSIGCVGPRESEGLLEQEFPTLLPSAPSANVNHYFGAEVAYDRRQLVQNGCAVLGRFSGGTTITYLLAARRRGSDTGGLGGGSPRSSTQSTTVDME